MWKLACAVLLLGCARRGPPPLPAPPPPAPSAASVPAEEHAARADAGSRTESPAANTPDGVSPADERACEAGDAERCTAIARGIAPRGGYRGTLGKDEADRREQATERYAARGCELGSGEGCALAGHYGAYHKLDQRLARACELGFVAACGTLGARQFYSQHNAAQRKQNAALVERACLANVQDWSALTNKPGGFCHMLFDWYRDRKLPKDRAAQARFLTVACEQGYGQDCPCESDADCHEDHFCGEGRCEVLSTH